MNAGPIFIIEKIFVLALSTLLFAPASAQMQQRRMARIGYLSPQSGPPPTLATFKEELRQLGWIEGKQIEFEYRYAAGDLDKLPEFSAELVRHKPNLIVTVGNRPPIEANRATKTIPIVMVGVVDPVRNGIVASLAQPGGNVTGVTLDVTEEQVGKNLEVLKEAVPMVSRIAVLRSPAVATHLDYGRLVQRAAKVLGVTIQFAELQERSDRAIKDALGAVVNERANALLVPPFAFFSDRRQRIINLVAQHKLPAIYFSGAFVDDGGLMSYGPNSQDIWRRAAVYVDKILKGTKPSDLPVEQPKNLELVINLKTAKQIGLTIPPNVLARADRVIK